MMPALAKTPPSFKNKVVDKKALKNLVSFLCNEILGTMTKPQNSPEKNSFKRTTKHPNSKSHEGEGPAKSDENLVHQ